MSNNTKTKRDELRQRLIDAAEDEIARLGMVGLKARSVTQTAGCALGALYNVVTDLDGLIILVNSRTIKRLSDKLDEAGRTAKTPEGALKALATAYVQFALSERNLWFAAFNHRLPDGQDLPDWHQAEYLALITHLTHPLGALLPGLSTETLALRAQTLFASVHGVVQLSLNGQFAGAPREVLQDEVQALVEALSLGLRSS
ncbi:MAG: TetR-like C-terminal domain-containing protein [Pseudomonadota bacterium]